VAFFLAIDVGGTKTDYVLADDINILARTRTGTIKRMRTDAQTATANLDQALVQLTATSGIAMSTITRTCVGTAGETVSLVTDWLRESITTRVSGELILVGDVEIALDAAFHGGIGVLAMAGTGSNVAGRKPDGTLITAGGWGPALADQGSGHRIGLETLRAAFLAKDEGHTTPLLEAILEFWNLASIDHLIEFANAQPAPDFSRLTELILDHANTGDSIATSVLHREAADLGWLVRLVLRQLPKEPLPRVAFTGSILEKVQPVRDALIANVRTEFPTITAIEGVVDPIAGALWRARSG
jgi:N-acetylglucosamine kinase-like BadF-type ATPase